MTIDTLIISTGHEGWLVRAEHTYTLYHRLNVTSGGEPQTLNAERKQVEQLPAGVLLGVPEVLLKGNVVTFRSQAGAWQLPVKETRDLAPPMVPDGAWTPGTVLQEIWGPLLVALGSDYTRPGLCALELVCDNYGRGHAASTDGYRLAYWHGDIASPKGTSHWPTAAVRWLARQRNWEWIVDGQNTIWVRGQDNAWVLSAPSVAGFPDYRKFVAESLSGKASCQVALKDLTASIKLCMTGGKPRRLRLDWENGVLSLSGSAKDGTTAFATLKVQTVGSASVLMDPDMLRPLLAGMGTKTVTLHSQGPARPLYVTAKNHLALQMHCVEEKR